MNEFRFIFQYYAIMLGFGLIGYVALGSLFEKRFFSLRYIVGKVIGLIIFGYFIWLLASLRILKFSTPWFIEGLFFITVVFAVSIFVKKIKRHYLEGTTTRAELRSQIVKFFYLELGVLALYALFLYIRSFNPNINGTEKFMDMLFFTSSAKTDYFPFVDPWFAGQPVNYYYYGFYLFSLPAKIGHIPYAFAYNLALGYIFALSTMLAIGLIYKYTNSWFFSVFGGSLAIIGGNLHWATCFFSRFVQAAPKSCYYASATRILDPAYTINEMPSYSFILGDLHPNLVGIPLFITNLFFVVLFAKQKQHNIWFYIVWMIILGSDALVNTWDFMTIGLLVMLVTLYKIFTSFRAKSVGNTLKYFIQTNSSIIVPPVMLAVSPLFFFLPFFLHFSSPINGVIFIPSFISHAGLAGKAQWPSSPWFLFGIWGPFFIAILISCILLKIKNLKFKIKNFNYLLPSLFMTNRERPISKYEDESQFRISGHPQRESEDTTGVSQWSFIAAAIILIIFTELFFVADLYHIHNPPYFRANTVWKLGYHAWMLFSFATAMLLHRLISTHTNYSVFYRLVAYGLVAVVSLTAFVYPVVGVNQAYQPRLPWLLGDRKPTLYGDTFMKNRSKSDWDTVQWINQYIAQRTVIGEAADDSYSYGGRMTVFTGMITPINWPSHEWTWRFKVPKDARWQDLVGKNPETGWSIMAGRVGDVARLYETSDWSESVNLIRKYNIHYVYIGDFERTTYKMLNEQKFRDHAKIIYQSGDSVLFDVHNI